MKAEKVWHGVMPEVCDLCQQPITNKFIDGKTIFGPWALMCTKCYDELGVGLGLGKGQEYSTLIKEDEGVDKNETKMG